MSVTAEVRTLALHPLAIHTFIKAQAGSLGKAMSEAVMNSLDAFAKNVIVTLTSTGFIIEDDGQGFKNKDEIAAWFETLGFPHDEGNHRIFGKFGMGRAQMWAYAHTVWRSNQFVMRVDVQRKGLSYELDIAEKPFQGTRIEATFYNELTFAQRETVEIELQKLVKYAPGMVVINDKVVVKDPSTEAWDLDTPEAWMRFDKKAHTLDVYNGGILVAHFPGWKFNATGIVVTKPEVGGLALNIARNEILVGECKTWAKIVKHFPASANASAKKAPPKLPQRTIEQVGREVAAGTRRIKMAMEATPGLVTSVHGRNVDYNDLVSYYAHRRPVLFVPKGDDFGKRLSKLKLALVLDRDVLKRFGLAEPAGFQQMLVDDVRKDLKSAGHLEHALKALEERVFSADAAALFPDMAAGRKTFATSELDDAGKVSVKALEKALCKLRAALTEANTEREGDSWVKLNMQQWFSVELGDSVNQLAWFNEANQLVFRSKDVLKAMQAPYPEMMRAMCEMLSAAFEDKFGAQRADAMMLRLLRQTDGLGGWTLALAKVYAHEARLKDLPVPKTRLGELDAANVE